MNFTVFISVVLGTVVGRLICDTLFKDDEKEKEKNERSDE